MSEGEQVDDVLDVMVSSHVTARWQKQVQSLLDLEFQMIVKNWN